MVQLNSEIVGNLIMSFLNLAYFLAAIIMFRKKQNSMLKFIATLGLFGWIQNLSQAISYMIVLENYPVAYRIKFISVLFAILQHVTIVWMSEYVQFHKIRIPVCVVLVAIFTYEIALLAMTQALEPYYFMEGDIMIAMSIGKKGTFNIIYTILGSFAYLCVFNMLLQGNRQAPPNLKSKTRLVLVFTIIMIILASIVAQWGRNIELGSQSMILFTVNNFLSFIAYLGFMLIVLFEPRLISILPFKLDKIIVLSTSGLNIFAHHFHPDDSDDDLYTGLLNALQSMVFEVLKKGQMEFIQLEKGIIIFIKHPVCTFALLSDKYSSLLKSSLRRFSETFINKYQHLLVNFTGDVSPFVEVKSMLYQYFDYAMFL